MPHFRKGISVLFSLISATSISLFSDAVFAATPVQAQTQCLNYVDMAMSARAMASLNIPAETTRAWVSMVYSLPAADQHAIADVVLSAAYQTNAEPQLFAKAIGAACMASSGAGGDIGEPDDSL